jgi:DNA-directed RNA polymerase II subunit RPB1
MPLSEFDYTEDVGTVNKVVFGILSPERIKEKSVCEIYKHITNLKNLEGTLMDPRLGPIERGQICPTCNFTYKNCPGHFGHLILAKPVIQIQYYNTIIKLLGCVCNRCSSILVDKYNPAIMKEISSRRGKGRYLYVTKAAQSDCPNCGATQPKFTKEKEGIARIKCAYGKDKTEVRETINAEIIHTIFKNVSDEDCLLLGLDPSKSRPEWMIWTIMPIPPPAMRPSVRSDSGKVSDDDLTHKLNDIIKFNNQLRIKIDEKTKQSFIDDWWQVVQYHVATYVDNELSNIPKATHRSGRPLKTIRQRVKAKEGRVRGNLMGKRVDGSARSVITADPNLSLDQLGVPRLVAMNLTYPELVTPYNITQMTQLVRNGPDVYPGAKSFRRKYYSSKKNLKFFSDRDSISLEPGDIVYRHLMDNDWVLFNRQPSLHKMSMMAHRVKVLEGKTFRLNVNVTSPYNADFDGDEMNMHVPQTLEAVNELRLLVSVPTQIVSPQSSKPVMGLVQDSLLGTNLFTKNTKLDVYQLMNLTGWINSYSGKIPRPLSSGKIQMWTGQQMISMFMPQINFRGGDVDIIDGKMLKGTLGGKNMKTGSGSLFHITWNDHGPLATRDFFNNMSYVANAWLQMNGFSVGLSDCVTTTDVLDDVSAIIEEYKAKAVKMIESANLGSSEKGSDPQTIKAEFAGKMIELLNKCRGEAEKVTQKNLDSRNSINAMVSAGSKGNSANIVQIVSLLGQQEVEGSWIGEQFYRRTLPHYPKDDLTPEAHGFIENSFMSGLTPAEYWFHAQAGRVGIISKAIKTAETGYIQRKLIKAMEDLRVCYDGTVRNANNVMIQTVYGNDGFDAHFHERQRIPFLNYNDLKMQREFKHSPSEDLSKILTADAYEKFSSNTDKRKLLDEEYAQIHEYYTYLKDHVFTKSIPANVQAPINMERLVKNVVAKFKLDKELLADIDPLYIVKQVKALRSQMVVDPNPRINYVSTVLINSLIATNLSTKNLIYRYKFNKPAFDDLINMIYVSFLKVLVAPGEMVGVIAAQSIGEPATQMTLDTFHHTGLGSKANVSRGVPRLRELLSLTRNPKTPSLTIQVSDQYFEQKKSAVLKDDLLNQNAHLAKLMAADMEFTILEDILVRTEIYYDEDDHKTCVTEDQEFIDSYYDLLPSIDPTADMAATPWLLRMEFNRSVVMNRNIPMSLIEARLRHTLQQILGSGSHTVILSDDNAYKLICRIKVSTLGIHKDPVDYLRALEKNLMKTELKGVNGIDKGIPRAIKKDIVLADGTIISPFDDEYEEASKTHNHHRWVIDTNGSNLIDVLNLSNVDKFNTICNDVWEVYQVYGIEAARSCLINEIVEVLEYSGSSINQRHIDLLVDVITNQGILVSVDRHGVNKSESGPLHRASFEETTAQITNASVFNEIDHMTGVSGNIMFGQFIPAGTNAFRLVLDLDKLKTLKHPEQPLYESKTGISVSELKDTQDVCNPANFQFTFKLNTMLGGDMSF